MAGLLTWLVIALVRPGPTRGTLAGKSGTTASRRPGETAQAIPAVRVVTDRGGKATYQVRASTVHMTLIFDGPCWVGMEIPGTPGYVTSRTYEAGQILQLARPAGFTLKVGAGWRAHGVLDGKPVGPWRGGNVWTLTVTQENPIGVGGTTKKAGA